MNIPQAITSLFVKSAVGDVFIPAGDPAEQIIANLMLSVVVCQLHSEKAAQSFIIRAHELTEMLGPRKVLAELPALGEIASERLYDSVDRILQKCLQQELPPSEPLDRASESFTLARDLIGKRNYSLAALALNDASAALDSYANASSIPSHLPLTLAMRTQIAGMLDEIRQRGM